MKTYATLIMPDNDSDMIKARHWLVARNRKYKTIYIPVTIEKKAPAIMTEFTLTDKILYRLTFGQKLEKISCFS